MLIIVVAWHVPRRVQVRFMLEWALSQTPALYVVATEHDGFVCLPTLLGTLRVPPKAHEHPPPVPGNTQSTSSGSDGDGGINGAGGGRVGGDGGTAAREAFLARYANRGGGGAAAIASSAMGVDGSGGHYPAWGSRDMPLDAVFAHFFDVDLVAGGGTHDRGRRVPCPQNVRAEQTFVLCVFGSELMNTTCVVLSCDQGVGYPGHGRRAATGTDAPPWSA